MRALNPELVRFYRNAFDPVLKEAAETQLAGNQDFSPIKMYCPYMPDESLLGPVQKDLLNKMVASGRKFVIKFFVSCIDGAREWDNACHFTIGRREDNQPVYIEIALLMLPEIYISRQLDEYFERNHGDSEAELFMRDVLGAKIYDELDEEFDGDYDLIDFDLLIKKECPADASLDDVLAVFKEELENIEENNSDLLSLREKIKQKVTEEKIAELTRDVAGPETAKGRMEALIDNGWSESLNGGQYGAFRYLIEAGSLMERVKEDQGRDFCSFKLYRIMGHLFYGMNINEKALASYKQALSHFNQVQNTPYFDQEDRFYITMDIGDVLSRLGQTSEALNYYNQSEAIFKENDFKDQSINSDFAGLLARRARLHEEFGSAEQAEEDTKNREKHLSLTEKIIKLFVETAKQIGRRPTGPPIDMREFPMGVRKQLKELSAQKKKEKGMNMFALESDRVIYKGTARGGIEGDKVDAEMHLKEGEIYTVSTTYVNDSRSYVLLKEVPDVWFNQVYFADFVD